MFLIMFSFGKATLKVLTNFGIIIVMSDFKDTGKLIGSIKEEILSAFQYQSCYQ